MTGPRRIQLSRRKGWRKPEGALVVARPTNWGNPFAIGMSRCRGSGPSYLEEYVKDGGTAVRFFADMLEYQRRPYPTNEEIRAELRGKDLACWCPMDAPCHADVLLEMANRR